MKRTLLALAAIAACGGAPASHADVPPATEQAAAASPQIGCVPSTRVPVEGRASPYDSVRFTLGGKTAQVCYNRPFAKGRQIFGGLLPWGELWRTGANEPTILHLPFAASIAGIDVPAGSYSLYTIPGETEWTIIINRSTDQWGHENSYTPEVEAQEVGRATVRPETIEEPVEQFTISTEPAEGDATHLVLAWERTRVAVPMASR